MNPTVARVRIAVGALFAVLGLVIAAEVLARDAPPAQKLLGLAFAAALVALGIVRVRMYAAAMRSRRP